MQRITDAANIKAFVLGGKAKFTLRSVKTGARFTYQVTAPSKRGRLDHDSTARFVSVLTGSDNTEDFTYMGTIFLDSRLNYRHNTRKSPITASAPSNLGFDFFWRAVTSSGEPLTDALEFYHVGSCARCGRDLTVPESIESGFGPVCAGKAGV